MAGAAFFDLDRTVLLGPSSNEINDALLAAGLVPDRRIPGMGLLGEFYRRFGETLPVMALARAAALAAKGWSVDVVAQAADQAGTALEQKVAPYVRPLLESHRAEGRVVVLATTSPAHLVRPLADRLGFDDVIATQYAVEDGRYTGGLDGNFVWATGKLEAVRRWAGPHQVSLTESYAYSDSIYDLPLLSAVGHPVAVNPDPRLRAFATVRRWPLLWLDVPPGVPKFAGVEPADVLRWLSRPELFPYARFDLAGGEHIPRSGPAIVVANHRSYFDIVAVGLTVMRAGRPVRFLGKKEVFDAPVIGPLAKAMGGIRVERGSGSGEPLREASRALAAGELVALMPQGTIPRGEAFFDPHLVGRPGAARLAAATGAPVIPIGVWGTERVWPRSSRLPRVTNLTHPPTVRCRVGPPVDGLARLSHAVEADTDRIMAAITALLPAEARQWRAPTEEELALTYPAGVKAST
jgi:putative phosphoserine phosphatase / 1-acylglycerol-3-phosphate O-acyltransferase